MADSPEKTQAFAKKTFFKSKNTEKDICDATKNTRKEEEEVARVDGDDICCWVNSPTRRLTG